MSSRWDWFKLAEAASEGKDKPETFSAVAEQLSSGGVDWAQLGGHGSVDELWNNFADIVVQVAGQFF